MVLYKKKLYVSLIYLFFFLGGGVGEGTHICRTRE